MRFGMPYVLYGVGRAPWREALLQLTEALCAVLDGSCDYDPDDPTENAEKLARCGALKKRLVLAMCAVEKAFPETEMSIFFHECVHIADFLYRWNNVRNYWCFVTERFVGYIKGFVHNRHMVH